MVQAFGKKVFEARSTFNMYDSCLEYCYIRKKDHFRGMSFTGKVRQYDWLQPLSIRQSVLIQVMLFDVICAFVKIKLCISTLS